MMKYEIGWHSSDDTVCHVASIDGDERDDLFDVQLYDPDVPEGDTNARQKSLDALQKLVDDANGALLKQALEGVTERARITMDEVELRARFNREDVTLPAIEGEKPAGELVELFDELVTANVIRVPDGYRLSVLNDDEVDITGIIVQVEALGEKPAWPLISDGWSDIDNYLPSMEEGHGARAKEAATCSKCLARTYRSEECVCPEGDAEDYDVAYEREALGDEAFGELTRALYALIGRADRCMEFIDRTRAAFKEASEATNEETP
jgi:hypothetical protein